VTAAHATYRIQSERYPGFAGYQQKTSRTIPVIALIHQLEALTGVQLLEQITSP